MLAASASAQIRVTGQVIDLQNKPVSDVIVKLVSGTKTLAFTSTNAKGEYALEVKSVPTGERLRVGERSSGMEHYRQSQAAERKATGRRRYVGNMSRDYMAYRLEQVKSRILARYQQKGGIRVTDF